MNEILMAHKIKYCFSMSPENVASLSWPFYFHESHSFICFLFLLDTTSLFPFI